MGVAGGWLREQRAEEVVHGWGSGTHSLRRGGNETAAGPGLEAAPAAGRLSCKSGWQTAAGRRPARRDPGPLLGRFVGHLDLQAALPTCVLWSLHFCGAGGCVLSDFLHTFGWLTSQQCSVPPSFPRCARCVSVLLPPEPTQGPLRQAASFQVSLLPQELVISGASHVPGKKKNNNKLHISGDSCDTQGNGELRVHGLGLMLVHTSGDGSPAPLAMWLPQAGIYFGRSTCVAGMSWCR